MQLRVYAQKLLLNVIGIIFIDIKNDQLGRAERSQLATELAADAAAASRYQNHLAAYMPADAVQIHLHRIPAKKIFNFHIADLLNTHFSVGQLIKSRQSPQGAFRLLTNCKNFFLLPG